MTEDLRSARSVLLFSTGFFILQCIGIVDEFIEFHLVILITFSGISALLICIAFLQRPSMAWLKEVMDSRRNMFDSASTCSTVVLLLYLMFLVIYPLEASPKAIAKFGIDLFLAVALLTVMLHSARTVLSAGRRADSL
jgi:hypothetical protein